MQSILAVVVTYNRLELLKKCMEALQSQSTFHDILVIDNASSDGTGDWLHSWQKDHPNTAVLSLKSNTGGAGGFKRGMERAVQKGYEFVWLMDDDCIPEPNALEEMMIADRRLGGPDHYGFLSSTVLWTDGTQCVMNHQKVAKQYYEQAELLQYGILRILQATFVSLLVPVSTIRKFGYVKEEYFIWNDDIEFTRRIAVRGKMPAYQAGKSIVVHATKTNIGSNIAVDDIERIPRYFYAYRNEFATYRCEGVKGLLWYFARCGRDFIWILFKAKDHRFKRLTVLLKGFFSGVVFFPKLQFPTGGSQ